MLDLKEPLIKSMNGIQEPKINYCCVAKLANIPDIRCVVRLALIYFGLLLARPGLKQRFLDLTSEEHLSPSARKKLGQVIL